MILQDIGMLAVSSNRTKLYLQQMAKHQLLVSYVLYMEDPSVTTPEAQALARITTGQRAAQSDVQEFDLGMSVPALLERYNIPYQRLPTLDPNSDLVVKAVATCPQSILIYSGPGGLILRKHLFKTGKRFLHVHPGLLPYYRGSTTAYYSLLKDGHCGVTAFFLDSKIDTGLVIRKRTYPAPADRTTIDMYYDPLIRSELLVEVLKEYAQRGEIALEPQDAGVGETYFIIHPVLKHIAILSHRGQVGKREAIQSLRRTGEEFGKEL